MMRCAVKYRREDAISARTYNAARRSSARVAGDFSPHTVGEWPVTSGGRTAERKDSHGYRHASRPLSAPVDLLLRA